MVPATVAIAPFPTLRLRERSIDIRTALVMGILNRTPDSFYDRGATWSFDAFLRRAEQLVATAPICSMSGA